MEVEERAAALRSFERMTAIPMLIVSVAVIPLLLVPLLVQLSAGMERVFLALDWLVWSAFAGELAVKTYLSERRWYYLLTHWYDVILVIAPFLRPLRVARSARALRLLRIVRVFALVLRISASLRLVLRRHGLQYALLVGAVIFLGCAGLVTFFERNAEGSIKDFDTALWWATVTVTTVGYGDAFPVTAEGRGVAVFLMFMGITLFSLITANISAFLVEAREQQQTTTLDDVMAQLRSLEERIAQLQLQTGSNGALAAPGGAVGDGA